MNWYLRRLLFDPDVPDTGNGGTQTPVPASTDNSQVQDVVSGTLNRDHQISFKNEQGLTQTVTLGQLADVYRNQPDADMVESAALFKKAMANDAEAAQQLIAKYPPSAAPTPANPVTQAAPTADAPQVAELQQQLAQLSEFVQKNISPVTQHITDQHQVQSIQQLITGQTQTYPFLAKDPNGALKVKQMRDTILAQARVAQPSFDPSGLSMESVEKLNNHCFATINKTIIADISPHMTAQNMEILKKQYEGKAPALATPQMKDDQTQPPEDQKSARFQLDSRGIIMDTSHPQPVPTNPMIPTEPVQPAPTGSMVGQAEPTPEGPVTKQAFGDRLKARVTQLDGTL